MPVCITQRKYIEEDNAIFNDMYILNNIHLVAENDK